MMSDLGAILGSLAVGEIAQHFSYGAAFVVSGVILLVAAVGWVFAPETRPVAGSEPTSVRPLGPEWAANCRSQGAHDAVGSRSALAEAIGWDFSSAGPTNSRRHWPPISP